MAGTLCGLGVGPGEGALVTEKAKEILSRTQVLCIPKSHAERESVAMGIVSPYLPAGAKIETLLFPMARDREVLKRHWELAATRVHDLLGQYETVTFVTIGDPLTYSTFGYLLRHVRRVNPGVNVCVVPGITSYHAAAARLGVPLVEGDERLAVLTVPVTAGELAACARYFDTVVLLKVSADFDGTLQRLREAGLDREAFLVSRVGSENEWVCKDPFSLAGQKVDYLSLVIVKKRGADMA